MKLVWVSEQLIPESLAARLLNVVVLDLHSNQLRVLPHSIGCLAKLKVLNVSGNLIESLPKTIEDCRYIHFISRESIFHDYRVMMHRIMKELVLKLILILSM